MLAAQAAIRSIIEDHPSSDLAVRIVLSDPSLPASEVAAQVSGVELAPLTDADIIAFLDTPEFSQAWDDGLRRAVENGTMTESTRDRFQGLWIDVVKSTMLGDRVFPGILQPALDEMPARLLVSLGRSLETSGLNFFERAPEGEYITLGNIIIRAFRRFQAETEELRERNAADRERNAADRELNRRFDEFLRRFGI